jgi:hypothetical protein
MEMDHLSAHTIADDGAPMMSNPPPGPPPRLRRTDYPTQAAFNKAVHLGREDYKRDMAEYQLRLDLIHQADKTITSPKLAVHSGIISLCQEPLL